jgi:MYXO-CTERM domain-containing protein
MRRIIAAIALTLPALWATAARAQTFPNSFVPLFCQRGYMVDGYRDQSGAVDDRDIVGAVDRPAGFRAVDDQFLYLRLRLDGSPMQGNGLTQFAWGIEVSTDGDPTDYEILIAVDGAAETVALYSNTVTTVPDSPADPADQLVKSYPFSQNGRVVDAGPSISGGGNDTFLDFAVPWSDLSPLGLSASTVVTVWAASSTNPDRLNGDFACHDGGGGTGIPRLSEAPPAPVAPDPGRSPGPVGGPSGSADGGGGNLIGSSGIEGGPGCDCGVAGNAGQPRALLGLAILASGWLARARRRRGKG